VKPEAIQIIRDEHAAIAAVLYSLRALLREIRAGRAKPDFRLLHAILDYIVSYPNRWHHPKEDQYLFPAVRAATAQADELLARLAAEHAAGPTLVDSLTRQLQAFERGEAGAEAAFADTAERFTELEWRHMRSEEDELLPLAGRVLGKENWAEIAQAFRENDNPLFGLKPKEDAERLYQKILSLAPPLLR
jgi:hemerythrin-like domain-containing protein